MVLDAVPAGSTILVCSDTYAENVVANKSVTLSGANTYNGATTITEGVNNAVMT